MTSTQTPPTPPRPAPEVTTAAPLPKAPPRPAGGNFNASSVLRMGVFFAIVFGLLGFVVFNIAYIHITGGISQEGDYFRVDLKAMSDFPMDQQTGTLDDVPERYRELDGERVILVGEMFHPAAGPRSTVGEFELVYSISDCCFSGPPQRQHFIVSSRPDGEPVTIRGGLVEVRGVLTVDVQYDEFGKLKQVYSLDVEDIRDT